jgi:hypothetical protein
MYNYVIQQYTQKVITNPFFCLLIGDIETNSKIMLGTTIFPG